MTISDEIGKQLHDRSTRRKPLTSEERKALDQWYAEQDQAESELLNRDGDLQTETFLHQQIDTILIRIGDTAEQIHKLTDENRELRRNITKIQRQLAEKNAAHPA